MNKSNPERERVWLLCQELMLAADLDGTILMTNPSWVRILGWDEAELSSMKLFDLVHPDDVQRTIGETAQLAHGITTTRFDNRLRHKDGSYLWISWTVVTDGKTVYAVGRELTPGTGPAGSEGTPRQEEKFDALGRFAGIIAHDFNNLLQGIVGSMELVRKLIKMGRIEETDRFIDNAMSSAKRATTLTSRLQDFSNREPSDAKPVEVNRVIGSMEDQLHRSLTPSINMQLALSVTLWTTLCDARQLENALLDLVNNSRDAMKGGGTIVIETTNVFMDDTPAGRAGPIAPGQYICVAVTDSGTGMSEETMHLAFDPLFTTKATGLGTGLGLSSVYGFTRQVQGHVKISSEIGNGTTVKLYLPRHRSEADPVGRI